MEFQALRELFKVVLPIRRKYPVIGCYIKFLNKIETNEDKQFIEISRIKDFMIRNPSLRDRILNVNVFKPTKGDQICFENVFKIGTPELVEEFWLKFIELEDILFPDGKPSLEFLQEDGAFGAAAAGGTGALSALENNVVLKDVINHVKLTAAAMGPGDVISDIFQSPSFTNIVKTIKGNLDNGKYKLSDITSTINDVLASINTGDMDENSKAALQTISSAMASAEQGQTPDMTGIMEMVGKLKFN